jgi:hypothetical protein
LDNNYSGASETTHSVMIYNDTLKNSYGEFDGVGTLTIMARYKPAPTSKDYENGYIVRYFAKKINENLVIEIKNTTASQNTSPLYKITSIKWKISGQKHDVFLNGIMNNAGVMDQNRSEIDRVMREDEVDLSRTLNNLLEYWQGR